MFRFGTELRKLGTLYFGVKKSPKSWIARILHRKDLGGEWLSSVVQGCTLG